MKTLVSFVLLLVVFPLVSVASSDPKLTALLDTGKAQAVSCEAFRNHMKEFQKKESAEGLIKDKGAALKALAQIEKFQSNEPTYEASVALLFKKGRSLREDDFSIFWDSKICNSGPSAYSGLNRIIRSASLLSFSAEENQQLTKIALKEIDLRSKDPGTIIRLLLDLGLLKSLVDAKLIVGNSEILSALSGVEMKAQAIRKEMGARESEDDKKLLEELKGKSFSSLPSSLRHKLMANFQIEVMKLEPLRKELRSLQPQNSL